MEAQENPLTTIDAKKFYEVQKQIVLTGHIVDHLNTVVSQEGRTNLCERRRACRAASPACSTPVAAQCVKVPRHVAYQAAALAEPLAVSLHAVARAGEIRDKNAIPFGAGPIGLLIMLAARLRGCGAGRMARAGGPAAIFHEDPMAIPRLLFYAGPSTELSRNKSFSCWPMSGRN